MAYVFKVNLFAVWGPTQATRFITDMRIKTFISSLVYDYVTH